MDRVIIKDYAELSDVMYALADEQSVRVAAVLFYEDAAELVKELLKYEDVYIDNIELASEDFDGYDKEYYVVLDSELLLSVEPAYREFEDESCYTYDNSDITFYGGNVNSKIAIKSDCEHQYELSTSNDERCEDIEIETDIDIDVDTEVEIDMDNTENRDNKCGYRCCCYRGFHELNKLFDFILGF